MKIKRILLVSCSIILLCLMIIAGLTYALFTDQFSVGNHLEAGRLNVTLERTHLEYSVLDEFGLLQVHTDDTVYDFTKETSENAFGINSKNIKIVPGSYFDATMRVVNDDSDPESANYSDVAFSYSVEVVLVKGYNSLARQMQVVVTNHEGVSVTKRLSDVYSEGYVFELGTLLKGEVGEEFSIRVEFLDDRDYKDENMDNDWAQGEGVVFDIIVKAVQATNAQQ